MNIGDKIEASSHEELGIDGKIHKVWSIKVPEPIKYSESEACMPAEVYENLGRYWQRAVNILNTRSMIVETLPFHLAEMFAYRWSHYIIITDKLYPIYGIDNNMIGYVDHDKTYYTDKYLLDSKRYKEYLQNHKLMIVKTVEMVLLILISLWAIKG